MDVVFGIREMTPVSCIVEDPMAHDQKDDQVVVTTRRGLSRIAFVAAETASRFEREGIAHDPVAWMMTPRKIFEGLAAIDACLNRHAFIRAAILHGLSWGLDASPEEIDPLIDDDDKDELEPDHIGNASTRSGFSGTRGRRGVTRSDSIGIVTSNCTIPMRRARLSSAKCSSNKQGRAPISARRRVTVRKAAVCPICVAARSGRR